MMKLLKWKRGLAFLLSFVMIAAQLQFVVMAENSLPKEGEIAGFAKLPKDVLVQSVPVGTELSQLNLPDLLTADIYHINEDGIAVLQENMGEEERESQKAEILITTSEEDIPVIWNSEPEYDKDTAGRYVFTADVMGFAPSSNNTPPRITVIVKKLKEETSDDLEETLDNPDNSDNPEETSDDSDGIPTEDDTKQPQSCTKNEECTLKDGHEGECESIALENDLPKEEVSGWSFEDEGGLDMGELALPGVTMEKQADFKTVVSMLPKQTRLEFSGESSPVVVDIAGWNCPEYKQEDGSWPLSGTYTFTAVLPEEYVCNPSPAVQVTLGGADVWTAGTEYAWDGSGELNASTQVTEGGTIIITGDGSGEGKLTVDKNNITITSKGQHVSGIYIEINADVDEITIKDLILTAKDEKQAIRFKEEAAMYAKGTCNLTGGKDGQGRDAIYAEKNLTIYVGTTETTELTITGGKSTETYLAGNGIYCKQEVTINNTTQGLVKIYGGDGEKFGGNGMHGRDVIINNDGKLIGEGGKVKDNRSASGIIASKSVTVSGSGTTIGRGETGIAMGSKNNEGVLTVNGNLTVEGVISGIYFAVDGRVEGNGNITAKGLDSVFYSAGILASSALTLSFTGRLTVLGGFSPSSTGGTGIYVANGNLIIDAVPDLLDIQPGKGTNGYGIVIIGKLNNYTSIPIQVNQKDAVRWPLYSVTYLAPDSDGGSVPIDDYSYFAGESVTVLSNTGSLTREGYSFYGWKNSQDNQIYSPGQTFQISAGDMTLTAQWSKITQNDQTQNNHDERTSSYESESSVPKDSYQVEGNRIVLSLSRENLRGLAESGKNLTIQSDMVTMTFWPAALKAILAEVSSKGDNIIFSAVPADVSAYPEAAAAIGIRPVYDFGIGYLDSIGNTNEVRVDFAPGTVNVSLGYQAAAGELAGGFCMVYVDESGLVTWLNHSAYDHGRLMADVPHFSVYGLAYKMPEQGIADIDAHWAKEDIVFAASRNLLVSVGNRLFAPDAPISRGAMAAALGRLQGIRPDSYPNRSFGDVQADADYAPYVEWAVQTGILKPAGENQFCPDEPVTREQMAVIFASYARQAGYTIKTPLNEAAYTDWDKISQDALGDVKAMQRAGIIKDKGENRFAPQENASRAEFAAALHRFVKVTINPASANGWSRNDSGQWVYHLNGMALIGWQYIGGKWYYFYPDGTMASDTEVDGYRVGADGVME